MNEMQYSNLLDRQIEVLDGIKDRVTAIEVHIAEIKTDVRHHIKRTDLLEAQVQALRDRRSLTSMAVIKDIGILIGIGVTLLKILNVI